VKKLENSDFQRSKEWAQSSVLMRNRLNRLRGKCAFADSMTQALQQAKARSSRHGLPVFARSTTDRSANACLVAEPSPLGFAKLMTRRRI
jgi:hypothetical protein